VLGKIQYLVIIIALVFFTSMKTAHAQVSSYEELQAAYIFNFAKYIRWPESDANFVIGVYGETDIMEFLEKTVAYKKVGNRSIELRVIRKSDSFLDCNIIYVPESDSKKVAELTTAIAGKRILIVTEEDLIRRGAAISFVVEDDRLRFKLKKSALADAGLTASEGLLKLAIQL
jgi:hypothetical protein